MHFGSALRFIWLKEMKSRFTASFASIHQLHRIRCWWYTRVSGSTSSPSGSTHLFETWYVCIRTEFTGFASLARLHLANMSMYLELHTEELSPQRSSHLDGSECWEKGRWKPLMPAPNFIVKVWKLSRYFIKCETVDLVPAMKENSLWTRVSAKFYGNSSE